jgi:polysaccharide biosynthesis protein PslH
MSSCAGLPMTNTRATECFDQTPLARAEVSGGQRMQTARRSPRILYLTHRVPYPPDKGDRIRNYHLIREMSKRGRVWLGCLDDESSTDESLAELQGLCERIAVVPLGGFGRWIQAGFSLLTGGSLSEGAFAHPGLQRALEGWAAETRFDAVVLSASSLAPYLRERRLANTPAIVDLMDVDSEKWLDFANASRGPKRWLYRLEAARVRKLERQLASWVRAAAVVSQPEADIFDQVVGQPFATVATNGVDLEYFQPVDGPVVPACAFVGAFDYLPNVDAAVWFAREVWPAVRQQCPLAEFWLIGRKPAPAVQALASLPGVKLIGQVPDVRPHLARAAVAVVPLRLARGIQNKVLEALAMGKPLVASPAALVALKAVPDQHLLEASTPAEWVEAIAGLLANPSRCRELGSAGRRYVEEHHRWETCLQPLLDQIFDRTAQPV